MRNTLLIAITILSVAFGVGHPWNTEVETPPNALFVIPSDTGDYMIVITAQMYLCRTDDPSDVLTRWTPDSVLPIAGEILKDGITHTDHYGVDHHFDQVIMWKQIQKFARKALGF